MFKKSLACYIAIILGIYLFPSTACSSVESVQIPYVTYSQSNFPDSFQAFCDDAISHAASIKMEKMNNRDDRTTMDTFL